VRRLLAAFTLAAGLAVVLSAQVITPNTAGSGSGGSSGGLTNTELRATPVPVSGTFWPATQPVSGTFWQATQPVSVASMPTTPVTGTFWQATQPVSGTFWQATQPVSGTFWQATQPVSGTFWQTTQPVSIASMPSTPVTGTFWQATQPVSLASVPAHAITIDQTTPGTTNGVRADSSGAIGAAVPSRAEYTGVYAGGNLSGLVQCDKSAQATIATATDTQLVALSGSLTIYVCSYVIEIQGIATTAGTLQLEYGTGTACATGKTAITPTFIGSTTAGSPWGIMHGANIGYAFKTIAGQALCANSTTTTTQKVFVTYAQF
jgi:hypothetical protein